MKTELDTDLLRRFRELEQLGRDDDFATAVMKRIDSERRRAVFIWSGVAVLGVVAAAALLQPAMDAFQFGARYLPAPLIRVETGWLQQLLSPVNSIAAAVAVGLLAAQRFWRWIRR